MERFKRFLNMKNAIDEKSATFHLSGFAYSDVCRTGLVSPWALMRIMEPVRFAQEINPSFKLFRSVTDVASEPEAVLAVVGACHLQINKALYKTSYMCHPYKLVTRGNHAGTRSISYCTDLNDGATDEHLATTIAQLVYIDKSSRKSVPLPQDIADSYKSFGIQQEKSLRLSFPELPSSDRMFSQKMLAAHSDTDASNHVNNSVFLRFCMDCAASACAADFLNKFKGDLFDYPVREAALLYKGECFPGDEINVQVWEDDEKPDTLYFQMAKGALEVVRAHVVFYDIEQYKTPETKTSAEPASTHSQI